MMNAADKVTSRGHSLQNETALFFFYLSLHKTSSHKGRMFIDLVRKYSNVLLKLLKT